MVVLKYRLPIEDKKLDEEEKVNNKTKRHRTELEKKEDNELVNWGGFSNSPSTAAVPQRSQVVITCTSRKLHGEIKNCGMITCNKKI